MGNSKENGFQESLNVDWILLKHDETVKLYAHKFSNDLCSRIKLYNIEVKQLEIYSSRKQYSFVHTPMIYSYHIFRDPKDSKFISSGYTLDMQVVVESTHQRLSDYYPINIFVVEEGFLVRKFEQILLGFQFLFNKYGPFKVNPTQIGWTSNHIIKVWIHENFAINIPQLSISTQQEMLRDIFHIFRLVVHNVTNIWTFTSVINQFRINRFQNQYLANSRIKDYNIINYHSNHNKIQPEKNIKFNHSYTNNFSHIHNIPNIPNHSNISHLPIHFSIASSTVPHFETISNLSNIRYGGNPLSKHLQSKPITVSPQPIKFTSVDTLYQLQHHSYNQNTQTTPIVKTQNLPKFQVQKKTQNSRSRKVSLKFKNFDDQFRNTMESINLPHSLYNSNKRSSHQQTNEPGKHFEQLSYISSSQSQKMALCDFCKGGRCISPSNHHKMKCNEHHIELNNLSRMSSQKQNVISGRLLNKNQNYTGQINNFIKDTPKRFESNSDNNLNKRYANIQMRINETEQKKLKKLSSIFQDENPIDHQSKQNIQKQDNKQAEKSLPLSNKPQKLGSNIYEHVEKDLQDLFDQTVSQHLNSQNGQMFNSLELQLDQMLN